VKRLPADPITLFVGSGQIQTRELALATSVYQFRIRQIGNDRPGFASRPRAKLLAIAKRQAGYDHRGVILLRAIDAVWILIVHRNLIDLRGWLVRLRAPVASAIERDVGAAIVGLDHDLRILRI